jgi:hypothetical protein
MASGPKDVVLPNVVVMSIGSPIIFIFESWKEMGFGMSQKLHPEFVSSGLTKRLSNGDRFFKVIVVNRNSIF